MTINVASTGKIVSECRSALTVRGTCRGKLAEIFGHLVFYLPWELGVSNYMDFGNYLLNDMGFGNYLTAYKSFGGYKGVGNYLLVIISRKEEFLRI